MSLLWVGDFEIEDGATGAGGTNNTQGGNLGWEQYDSTSHFWVWQSYEANIVPNSRYPSPPTLARDGRYMARFELRNDTDNYNNWSGQRAQLIGGPGSTGKTSGTGGSGGEYWGVSIFVPSDYTEYGTGSGSHWMIPWQFHHNQGSGQAPVNLQLSSQDVPQGSYIPNGNLRWFLDLNQGTDANAFNYTHNALGAAVKGAWNDLVFHIVWSSDSSVGLTEAWLNGTKVLSQHHVTVYPGTNNYLQIGVYREGGITGSNVLYLDAVRGATTFAEADPATYAPALKSYLNSSPPSITGNRTLGSVVTANPGTWAPTPPGFVYAWERADDTIGTNRQTISGATASTYALTAFDVNKYLRVGVYPSG